jgi:hypothetical protein
MSGPRDKNLFVPSWYPALASYTFPTQFVSLHPEEVRALADGVVSGPAVQGVIGRLQTAMKTFSGSRFVFADSAAPTDTERFALRRGAVSSAESAWKFLALSEKVRKAAAEGGAEHICVRPFRRMTKPREFRLFIYDGVLTAMSQYWLVRHFRRLEGPKNIYWEKAKKFTDEISWLLPVKTLAADIYFTAKGEILIVDLNPWGPPTDPLMLGSWDKHDWKSGIGIKLIPPPIKISGDVSVSF